MNYHVRYKKQFETTLRNYVKAKKAERQMKNLPVLSMPILNHIVSTKRNQKNQI